MYGVFTVEFDQIEITAEAGNFRVQTLRKPEHSASSRENPNLFSINSSALSTLE